MHAGTPSATDRIPPAFSVFLPATCNGDERSRDGRPVGAAAAENGDVDAEGAGTDGLEPPGDRLRATRAHGAEIARAMRRPVLGIDVDVAREADDVEVRDHAVRRRRAVDWRSSSGRRTCCRGRWRSGRDRRSRRSRQGWRRRARRRPARAPSRRRRAAPAAATAAHHPEAPPRSDMYRPATTRRQDCEDHGREHGRHEPRGVLAPGVAVDHDPADEVLAGGDRVEADEQVAGPALLRARGQLRGREEREQHEQAEREAEAVGAAEHADHDAERREEDGEQRADHEADGERLGDDPDAVGRAARRRAR